MHDRRQQGESCWPGGAGWVYGFSAVALLLPSWLYWGKNPWRIIDHEFDFWIGQMGSEMGVVLTGRAVFTLLTLLLGLTYLRILARLPRDISVREVVPWVTAAALLFSTGLPFISPDVFYYLGKGWHAVHYGADVFREPIAQTPGWEQDPMFRNIHPAFIPQWGNYGPYFHALCMGVAGLSGGEPWQALLVFKWLCLAGHGLTVWGLAVLARQWGQSAGKVVFAYGMNPLVLLCLLTTNHNEAVMMPPLVWAMVAAAQGRGVISAIGLGLAFGIKLIPAIAAPALAVAHYLNSGGGVRGLIKVAGWGGVTLTAALGGVVVFSGSWASVLWIFEAMPLASVRATIYMIPALIEMPRPGEDVWLRWMLAAGKVVFIGFWSWIFLMALGRQRPVSARRLTRWVMGALVGYLVVVTPFVAEWYLVWFTGLGLALGGRHAKFVAVLTVGYLPLVIWLLKEPAVVALLALNLAWLWMTVQAAKWAWPGMRAEWRWMCLRFAGKKR